jgi:hypothetical protein
VPWRFSDAVRAEKSRHRRRPKTCTEIVLHSANKENLSPLPKKSRLSDALLSASAKLIE